MTSESSKVDRPQSGRWTPGPWDAYITDHGFGIYQTDGHGTGDHIMAVYDDPESLANTRLIAAAPEMAALLERFADGPMSGNSYEFEKEARALLARIRGGE